MFILTSIIWGVLLVLCVSRATKNAYADGYDVGYLAGSNGWERHEGPPPQPPAPRIIVRRSTVSNEEIDEFLNQKERVVTFHT